MIIPLLNIDFQKRFLFLLEKLNYKWQSGQSPCELSYLRATYLSFLNKKLRYGDRNYSDLFNPDILIGENEMKYFPEDSKQLNRFI